MANAATEEVNRLVKEKLATGKYDSEAEVLLAALRSLQMEDEEVAAIEAGLADVRAGRTQPLAEVDAEVRAKFNFLDNA